MYSMFSLSGIKQKSGLGNDTNDNDIPDDKENLILSFHNSLQSVILLKNELKQKKNGNKKKYHDKVLNAREATKRATMELVKQKDSLFETTAEKHLFTKELQDIANNATNISSILSMDNILLSSTTRKAIEEVLSDIIGMAKDMDFNHSVDAKHIVERISSLRQLIYDQNDRSSYVLMEKIVDSLQSIASSLEKANEFSE